MKKSVVILIAIIYVTSIALVSFFGLQFKVFEQVIDVERIEILNEGLKYNSKEGYYTVIEPNENGERRYKIEYRVHPDDATNSKVEFSYDKQNTNVTVDESGLITFKTAGAVKVQIIATDGSGASATITVFAK